MRRTLRKTEILRGKKNFQEIFDNGKKINGSVLRCLVLQKSEQDSKETTRVKVAFVVPRTIRRATDRNRIKRLMRESYRLNKHIIPAQFYSASERLSLLFLFNIKKKGSLAMPQFTDIENEMKAILNEIIS